MNLFYVIPLRGQRGDPSFYVLNLGNGITSLGTEHFSLESGYFGVQISKS